MKKVFLLAVTTGLALSSFAQHAKVKLNASQIYGTQGIQLTGLESRAQAANKTTTDIIHDSLVMMHRVTNDTIPVYITVNVIPGSNDSGYFTGTGYYEFTRFAERYDFTYPDSSIQVLGIVAAMKGASATPSTHNAVFKVWNSGSKIALRPTLTYSGFPTAQIDSVVVPYSSIGFNQLKAYWFATPTAYLTDSFFVGYSTDYTWSSMNGDTLSVYVSNQRLNPLYNVVGGDTLVNDQSVIGDASGWADLGNDLFVDPLESNYWMFPIINSKIPVVGVGGITKKDFTFMGNYPNPCVNNTNIKFALAGATDVTITVMDINSRVMSTEKHSNMSAGEHVINLNTANLASGEYMYVISTTNGGGIASKIAVIK